MDYLVELGRQSENMNTSVGARYGVVDDVFAGKNNSKFNLGADSDIASGKLRFTMERSFNNLVGDFHVPKQFVDRVALHIAKNLLMDPTNPGVGENALGNTRVPVLLGIWGSKGCGKTFNLELACRLLGVHPVVMSAGELEDEWAGEPGRLIRRRYRHAAEIMKTRGKATCLIINDIDAGVGWFKQTQSTVNTQMVMGTLMNICDHPNSVSNEEDDEIHAYREDEYIRRVPIILTGNDLSTLYAPLLRDGRMDKFYWTPTRDDICDMVHAMYRDDDVSRATVERLVETFPDQPLDFFGAIRSRLYDDVISRWADTFRGEPDPVTGQRLVSKAMGESLMNKRTHERPDDEEDPGKLLNWRPDFVHHGAGGVDMSEAVLFEHAKDLAREQELVNEKRLSDEYMRYQKTWEELVESGEVKEAQGPSIEEKIAKMVDEDDSIREAQARAVEAAREALRRSEEVAAEERRRNPPPPEPEPQYPRWWQVVTVKDAFTMFKEEGVKVVDVRGARDHDKEAVMGSVNVPAVNVVGRPLHWEKETRGDFESEFSQMFPDPATARVLILGAADAENEPDGACVVLDRLRAAGFEYVAAVEVAGGYDNWVKQYTPAGKKRTGNAKYTNVVGAPGTICAFSEIITQEDGVFDDPTLMRKTRVYD